MRIFPQLIAILCLLTGALAFAESPLEHAGTKAFAQEWAASGYFPENIWKDYFGPNKCLGNETYRCIGAFARGLNNLQPSYSLRFANEALQDGEILIEDFGEFKAISATRIKETAPKSEKQAFIETQKRTAERRILWNKIVLTPVVKAKMKDFISRLTENDPLKKSLFAEGFMNKYLSVNDPFGGLTPTNVFRGLLSETEETDGELGVRTVVVGSVSVVTAVELDSPAFFAGVRQFDEIRKVDNIEIARTNEKDFAKPVVHLTVSRQGKLMELTVDRRGRSVKKFKPSVISWHGEKYLRLTLNSFMGDAAMCLEIDQQMKFYKTTYKPRGIILDLRNNGGGSVEFSTCVGTLFLGIDVLMATSIPLNPKEETLELKTLNRRIVDGTGLQTDLSTPFVVMMNGRSASASELFAGAIRDHNRGWIVGQLSYGKGSVSVAYPFQKSKKLTELKTGAIFHQPNGTSNELVGIIPDFAVPSRPDGFADEDFAVRNQDANPELPFKRNEASPPPRKEIVQSMYPCIEHRQLQDRVRAGLGSAVTPDYQLFYSLEVLRCEGLRQKTLR